MYGAKRKGKGRVEHRVVDEALPRPAAGGQVERRATARVLCGCAVRVRPEGAEEVPEELATVRDISPGGVGLDVGRPFPPDTVLIVEPLSAEATTLLARVVHTTQNERGWTHG